MRDRPHLPASVISAEDAPAPDRNWPATWATFFVERPGR